VANAWPTLTSDAVFSANTTHIMHYHEVEQFFAGVGHCLTENGHFLLYGPFNYDGQYTSDSNRQFDHWLKDRDPHSAIRDFEQLNQWATRAGLSLRHDYAMPANNRILHWQKAAR
jgi:cyclopropane fatty-acyl-phospholipid synthase-like methyltransferase